MRKEQPFNFDSYLELKLKNPRIKKAYDEERFMTSVLAEIYALRKESKITQKELAERINIPQSELSRIETGNQNISLQMFFRIMSGMGRKPHTVHTGGKRAITF